MIAAQTCDVEMIRGFQVNICTIKVNLRPPGQIIQHNFSGKFCISVTGISLILSTVFCCHFHMEEIRGLQVNIIIIY